MLRSGTCQGARAKVIVIDRIGLIARARIFYGVPEAELFRFLRK